MLREGLKAVHGAVCLQSATVISLGISAPAVGGVADLFLPHVLTVSKNYCTVFVLPSVFFQAIHSLLYLHLILQGACLSVQ